jgi:secreted trypsin-like serine protease
MLVKSFSIVHSISKFNQNFSISELHEFPYQVSFQVVTSSGLADHYCGGSILQDPTSTNSSRFVLTAAHCKSTNKMQVAAGEYDFKLTSGFEEVRPVTAFVIHEDYGFQVGPHDLAVVKVDPPFVFNEAVQPVDLPKRNAVPVGEATISGWGSMSTSFWPDYPDVLQTAQLPIIKRAECEKLWEGQERVHNENVCAGTLDGSQAVCSGDSGGPLVQRGATKAVQVGIVSWGAVPCGQINRPGVFGRVSAYVDWIENTIKQLS